MARNILTEEQINALLFQSDSEDETNDQKNYNSDEEEEQLLTKRTRKNNFQKLENIYMKTLLYPTQWELKSSKKSNNFCTLQIMTILYLEAKNIMTGFLKFGPLLKV